MVTNDRELGICLVTNGIKPFDESVQPYLDYKQDRIEYYSDHGGAYTAFGELCAQARAARSRPCRTMSTPAKPGRTLGGMKME